MQLLVDNAILSFIKSAEIGQRVKEIFYSRTQYPIG
jgi:hypothetical protein